jgi:hypothetical protein
MLAAFAAALTKVKSLSPLKFLRFEVGRRNLLLVTFRPKLSEVGPKVAGLLFILDARKNHLGIRNLGTRVL